jgi:hypothetical protein
MAKHDDMARHDDLTALEPRPRTPTGGPGATVLR